MKSGKIYLVKEDDPLQPLKEHSCDNEDLLRTATTVNSCEENKELTHRYLLGQRRQISIRKHTRRCSNE